MALLLPHGIEARASLAAELTSRLPSRVFRGMAVPDVYVDTAIDNSRPELTVIDGEGAGTTMPTYDSYVDNWQELKTVYRPTRGVAQIVTSQVTMSDGSQNIVREIEPVERKYGPILETGTPLATRVNGWVTYLGIQAAKQGSRVRIVGAPQNPTDDPHLSHQSHTRAQVAESGRVRDGEVGMAAMYFGYSQPGMMAPAVAYYLKQLGVETPVLLTEDQCLAVGRTLAETRVDMTPVYIGRELLEGGRGLVTHAIAGSPLHGIRRLRHLAGTIGLTPSYLRTHHRITLGLWEGEAGSFVDHVPEETVYVAHFRTESPFNDMEVYTPQIQTKPLGRVIWERGRHLTAVDRNITLGHVGKMTLSQEMYDQGESLQAIANALDYPLGSVA